MHGVKKKALPAQDEKRRHSVSIRIRFEPGHDKLIRKAAEQSGLSLSGWVRERLLSCAQAEIKK
jgi:uncharacterized protein (DUF1778 family)